MNETSRDFQRAIEGVVSARTREHNRQVCRSHEHQLIGAVTKRPN